MSYSFIQHVRFFNSSFSGTSFTTGSFTIAAGHLVVLDIEMGGVGFGSNIPVSVVDTLGNTYINQSPDSTAILFNNGNIFPTFGVGSSLWYCPNAIPGTGTITATFLSSLSGNIGIDLFEYGGIKLSNPVVGHQRGGGNQIAPTASANTVADGGPSTNNMLFANWWAVNSSNIGQISAESYTARFTNGAFQAVGEQPSVSAGGEAFSVTIGANCQSNFLAFVFAVSISISGNAGTPGATITFTGPSSGTVTADGSGNYTIPDLANGTYTITPSKTGFSFSPPSQNITVSGSDVTGVNFTASGTLQISGSTGVPGVTVTWVNNDTLATGSVTADGSGNYAITGLTPNNYEVAPNDLLNTFVPSIGIITLVASNVVQNFANSTPAPLTCTSVQIGADTFTRANENPLNPAVWQQIGTYAELQVVSNTARGTVISGPFPGTFNAEQFIATWPTNVYTQVTIAALTADGTSNVELDMRSDSLVNNAVSAIVSHNPNGNWTIQITDSGFIDQGLYIFDFVASVGDVFRFELSGQICRFVHNGVLIAIGDLGSSASYGTFGDLAIEGQITLADAQVTNFSFGSLTCSSGGGGGARPWVSPLIISSIEKGNA